MLRQAEKRRPRWPAGRAPSARRGSAAPAARVPAEGGVGGSGNWGCPCLLGLRELALARCPQRSSALVSPAPRPAPAAPLAADARPPARALRRRAGLVVAPSPGRGRALRPPLRPHYGGAHAAHRVVGARRGPPRLSRPPAPWPPPSRPRGAGRRVPAASLSAAVRARRARVGARQPPRLTVAAPPLPSPAALLPSPAAPGPGGARSPSARAGEGRVGARPSCPPSNEVRLGLGLGARPPGDLAGEGGSSQASGEDGWTRAARCEVTCVRDPAALRTLAQRRDGRAGLRCGKRGRKSPGKA